MHRSWPATASRFETWFGPQGAVTNRLSSPSRDGVEAKKAGNGKPEVASSAAGDSHLCPQPGRGWKRAIGIRHRVEHFRRRGVGCRAPLLAACGAAFARNSQRALGFGKLFPQSLPHLARAHGADYSLERLPLARPQVLPTLGGRQVGKARDSTES